MEEWSKLHIEQEIGIVEPQDMRSVIDLLIEKEKV